MFKSSRALENVEGTCSADMSLLILKRPAAPESLIIMLPCASEPQRRVRDFCLSPSEESELSEL